jgi:hypothetical protein
MSRKMDPTANTANTTIKTITERFMVTPPLHLTESSENLLTPPQPHNISVRHHLP